MDRLNKIRIITLLVGLSLLVPASIGLFSAGSPTVLCPFPALTVIPAFFIASFRIYKLAVLIPTALFFAWIPGLLRESAAIPRRTYLLFGCAVVLSVIWFLVGWQNGLHYQGLQYAQIVGAINLFCIVTIGVVLLSRWRKAPSIPASLLLHWMLFVWLGWYAFPYLGELP